MPALRSPPSLVPGDALVRDLLHDPSVPLLMAAADFGRPVQARVIQLTHFFHAFHEARELLELSPLIVGGAGWDVDLDRPFYGGHALRTSS